MSKENFQLIKRQDYQPPPFLVESIHLCFALDEERTMVTARSSFFRNEKSSDNDSDLILYGEQLELAGVKINGIEVENHRLVKTDRDLKIADVPDRFSLEIITFINPAQNTRLSGLYLSLNIFCTQCEAEGFRRITYYPDRPDVLAEFTARIEAARDKYPVLLSNGNLIEQGELPDGRHYAQWHDPFPKPSYLFALVAGDLIHEHDRYTTGSGRVVDLFIYTEPRNRGQCGHAMRSLKKAMRWDEEVFGLEYDLDRFMIVAVDDFNMGAMENKGLNIFNSKYILASPETATDQDYLSVEGVIAHEYFHNWTGNRVTCRDWFQLSLKEGLTVFRDQEFSAEMNSRAVQRIKDVRILRQFQFREDEGPMAHPVRPDSYLEINNFYTVTVYNKGAEVVRMLHTLIGAEAFRKGMDLYFSRHDGQAVTCDDFVCAMADASGRDLLQFKRWYAQAGTPHLQIDQSWNQDAGQFQLTVSQHTDPTPGQPVKDPFHLPILLGLLDEKGHDLADTAEAQYQRRGASFLLELTEQRQTFLFNNLPARPLISFLRSFSAPVVVEQTHARSERAFLMAHDSDLFNRWESAFSLSCSINLELFEKLLDGESPIVDELYIDAFSRSLDFIGPDPMLTALALQQPEESYLAQLLKVIEPAHLHRARRHLKTELADRLQALWEGCYRANHHSGTYHISPEAIGRRNLKNVCLDYLLSGRTVSEDILQTAATQYYQSTNMTDQIAVLASITHLQGDTREELFAHFEKTWNNNPLVMDKWFALQALSSANDTFERVQTLLDHPSFSLKNPNKVRALIGAFSQNHAQFHDISGRGYLFLAEKVLELDRINAQIAARMVNPLITWKRYEPERSGQMKEVLESIQGAKKLSRDVFEIVEKSLI